MLSEWSPSGCEPSCKDGVCAEVDFGSWLEPVSPLTRPSKVESVGLGGSASFGITESPICCTLSGSAGPKSAIFSRSATLARKMLRACSYCAPYWRDATWAAAIA